VRFVANLADRHAAGAQMELFHSSNDLSTRQRRGGASFLKKSWVKL
jgi:hypothetical protein